MLHSWWSLGSPSVVAQLPPTPQLGWVAEAISTHRSKRYFTNSSGALLLYRSKNMVLIQPNVNSQSLGKFRVPGNRFLKITCSSSLPYWGSCHLIYLNLSPTSKIVVRHSWCFQKCLVLCRKLTLKYNWLLVPYLMLKTVLNQEACWLQLIGKTWVLNHHLTQGEKIKLHVIPIQGN